MINKNIFIYILILVIVCIMYYNYNKYVTEGLSVEYIDNKFDFGSSFYIKKKNDNSRAFTVEQGEIQNNRNIVLDNINDDNTRRQMWVFDKGYIHLAHDPTYVLTLAGNIRDYRTGRIIIYRKWLEHDPVYKSSSIYKDSQSWIIWNGWIKNISTDDKFGMKQWVIQAKPGNTNRDTYTTPLSINELNSNNMDITSNQKYYIQNFPGNSHPNCPEKQRCLYAKNDNIKEHRSFKTTYYHTEIGSDDNPVLLYGGNNRDISLGLGLVKFGKKNNVFNGMFTFYPSNRIEMFLSPITMNMESESKIFRIISNNFIFTLSFQQNSFKLNYNYKTFKNIENKFFETWKTLQNRIKFGWDNDFDYNESPILEHDETVSKTPILANYTYKLIIVHSVVNNELVLNSSIVDNDGIIYNLIQDKKINIQFWDSEKNGISSYMIMGSSELKHCARMNYSNLKYTFEKDSEKSKYKFISKYSKINIINNIYGSNNQKFTLNSGKHKDIIFTKDYYLEFTIWPDQTSNKKWINILHGTISNEMGDYSQQGRIPGVWFWPNTKRLHIVHGFGKSGEIGYNFSINPEYILPNHQNTRVIIICEGNAFKVFLMNDRNMIVENISKKSPRNKRVGGYGRLYISSPAWDSAKGFIHNLSYCTLNYTPERVSEIKNGDFIALWNPNSKRFIGMGHDKTILTSNPMNYDLPNQDNYAKWLISNAFLNNTGSNTYMNNLFSFYNVIEKRFFIADNSSNILLANEGEVELDDIDYKQTSAKFQIIKSTQFKNKQYLIKLYAPFQGLYIKMPENINNESPGSVLLADEKEYNEDIKNNKGYLYELLPVEVKYDSNNIFYQIGIGNREDQDTVEGSAGFTERSCKQKCNMTGDCIGVSYKKSDGSFTDNSVCKLFNTSVIKTDSSEKPYLTKNCNNPNSGIYYEKSNNNDKKSPLNSISKIGCFKNQYSNGVKKLSIEKQDSNLINCMYSNDNNVYFGMNGGTCFTDENVFSDRFNHIDRIVDGKCMDKNNNGSEDSMLVYKLNHTNTTKKNYNPPSHDYIPGTNNPLSIFNKPVYISLYHFRKLPKGCEIGNFNSGSCMDIKSHDSENNWIEKNLNVEFETSSHRLGSIKNYDYVKPSNDGNDSKLGLYVANNESVSDILDQNWNITKVDNDLILITDSDGFNIAYNENQDLIYLSNSKNEAKCHWKLIKFDEYSENFESKFPNNTKLPYHSGTRNKVKLDNFIYFIKHSSSNKYLNGGGLLHHTRFNTRYYKKKFNMNKLDYVSNDSDNIELNKATEQILKHKKTLLSIENRIKSNEYMTNNHNVELKKIKETIIVDIHKQEDIIKSNPKKIGFPVRRVLLENMDDDLRKIPTVWPWIIIPKTLVRSDIEYDEEKAFSFCDSRGMRGCSVNELYDYSQLGISSHNDVWTSTKHTNNKYIVGKSHIDLNKENKLGFYAIENNKNKHHVACCYNGAPDSAKSPE